MSDAELASYTKTLRQYMDDAADRYTRTAELFIVFDLQMMARPRPDHPEWDATDAELGARVRMLLAALEAAKTPEPAAPVDPESISKQVIGVPAAEWRALEDPA